MTRWLVPAGGAALLLALIAALASTGGENPFTGLAAALSILIRAGAPALAYLAGAAGWGRLMLPLCRRSPHPVALQVALGLAILLSLSHLLGVMGLFAGRLGLPVGAGVVGAGLLLLGHQIARRLDEARTTFPPAWLLAVPALALLLVAACQPPGWLWASEAGGYDALSYHLQLPQEWLAAGRIRPLTHNVFSFLPSYVEAAYVHVGAMTGAAMQPLGLLAGEGYGVISCQLLSAGLALFAVAQSAALASAALARAGLESPLAPALAGVLLLSTPWTIVVGSLAYNDLAVVGFIAAALVTALDDGLPPSSRGVCAGVLIGAACGCKPTALIFGAPPVAIALLTTVPARQWAVMAAGGAMAGIVMLAPWLTRNWAVCGNPVFPQATRWFGTAHWSADQVRRYTDAVSFHGSLWDRARLMVAIDPTDPAGPRHRGALHPQWFAFFPIAVAALMGSLSNRSTRRVAAILSLALATQIAAWMFLTHIQSRFLLPLAAPACALVALAVAPPMRAQRLGPGLGALACGAQTLTSILLFAQERSGHPNQMLLAGPGARTGEVFRAELAALSPADRARAVAQLGPEPFVNLGNPAGSAVYLLGSATPLYFTVPVVYNTTWDSWPLGDAMRAAPADPAAWTRALASRGIRYVLVDFEEIGRLIRSGWCDPAVTPESVSSWLAVSGRAIRQWPDSAHPSLVLFQLLPSGPETPR